jgi:hypothetical protein
MATEGFDALAEKSLRTSGGREKGVRNHLCEAPAGPVPGKWFLTPFSRQS